MRVIIIGAGPVGLVAALLLARQGQPVTVVDSDRGPDESGEWERTGVYQFHQPHILRAPTAVHLERELPEVYNALLTAGAQAVPIPPVPGAVAGLRTRRQTFEGTLRAAALRAPGVTVLAERVSEVEVEGTRVTGVRVATGLVPADLVIDATGRSGLTTALRDGTGESSSCGFSYISRAYRRNENADPPPMNALPGLAILRDGYACIAFAQDDRRFQVLVVRRTADKTLATLREESIWDAVVPQIPALSPWLDADESAVTGPPKAGNAGRNSYRGQACQLTGLLAIGDAVSTTNPMGARGISVGISTAVALTQIMAATPQSEWARALGRWCTGEVRPWFEDQIASDGAMQRRWAGEAADLDCPLPVDLIASTAEADPEIMKLVGPYLLMATTSHPLRVAEERAREILRSGWRPQIPESPSHAELAQQIRDAAGAGSQSRSPSAAWAAL